MQEKIGKLQGRPLTPEEQLYVERYLEPKWKRNALYNQLRTQLYEFLRSSEKEWNVQIPELLDAWKVFKCLHNYIQNHWCGNEAEIKVVVGKTVTVHKL